jgi:hypothetical protein
MKKYVKQKSLLLASTCFMGLSLLYSSDVNASSNPFETAKSATAHAPNPLHIAIMNPFAPLAVVEIQSKDAPASSKLALQRTEEKIQGPDGRTWHYSELEVADARVDIFKRGNHDAPELEAPKEIRRLLGSVPAEGKDPNMDSRDPAEYKCDESIFNIYFEFEDIQKGLTGLSSGDISRQLKDLTKAISNLDSQLPIGKLSQPLLKLIEIVYESGESLRRSLQNDLGRILGIAEEIIDDCNQYIDNRDGPRDGLSLADILPLKEEVDGNKGRTAVNRLYAVEMVNVTEIKSMLFEVQKTLRGMKDGNLGRYRKTYIEAFLRHVGELDQSRRHAKQIKGFAHPFKDRVADLSKMDQQLESSNAEAFATFLDGIGHIDKLLVALTEYLNSASGVSQGALAKNIIEISDEGEREKALRAIDARAAFGHHEIEEHLKLKSFTARPAIEAAPSPAVVSSHSPVAASGHSSSAPHAASSSYDKSAPLGSIKNPLKLPGRSSPSVVNEWESAFSPMSADEDDASGFSSHVPESVTSSSHSAGRGGTSASRSLDLWQDPSSVRLEKIKQDLWRKAQTANDALGYTVYSDPPPASMDEPFYKGSRQYLESKMDSLENDKAVFVQKGETILEKVMKAEEFIAAIESKKEPRK